MAGISSRQAEYIADLWEQTGEPFKIRDAMDNLKVTHRDGFVQFIQRERNQVWAQNTVATLRQKLSESGNKSDPSEMATQKQVAYGRNLDVQKNGKAVHDWDRATKAEAWQWIADLKTSH